MGQLESEAAQILLEAVKHVEARADACWHGLKIRYLATDVARWGVLVAAVREVERQQALHRTNTAEFDAALINLGRLGAIALHWAVERALPISMPLRWTGEVASAVDEALAVANQYNAFALPARPGI